MPAFLDFDPSIHAYRLIVLTEDAPRLEVSEGHSHDEGWSRTYATWEYDPTETRVVYTEHREGRDCDGATSSYGAYACPVADLAAREATPDGADPIRVPAWRELTRTQHDYAAEAAGY